MKLSKLTKNAAMIALSFSAAGFAGPRDYVDDNLDYVDPMVMEMAADAPDVYALPDGVAPYTIPETGFEADVNGGQGDESRFRAPSDGDGPFVGENYVRIYIGSHVNAGSDTDYLIMNFGRGRNMRLYGYYSGGNYSFPRGWTLTWDLAGTVAEDYPQETWDEISFWTNSGDGLQVARVMIVHSGVEILDWSVNRWLDAPTETSLGTGAMMLERKLEHVANTDHAAVHFGARELGKTNGYKYGDGRLWCSEFASWCLWKEGFWTPRGNIGTDDMEAWFSDRGRLYTRSQVTSETYVMRAGDYLSLWNGDHSAIFVSWIDDTTNITTATRFRTIEGNTGQHVDMRTRSVADIYRVGSAQ
jgi:hypothetical protein